ncbi:hypothetical protein [Alienimonas californiensis]|uniref:Uncharacterized protein n=1 Tax=Alienimonas californiensis TaxID=2527989 RepID=A0A517P4J3_9PLAN|nr:hypothetical protein [Alienimonas californiensis]QDT14308.1 hypothetical protein CA12_03800 [Alienimonas californiensis]
MARKTASRMELRRQHEIAEQYEAVDKKTAGRKTTAKRKTTTRKRADKAPVRKLLMWAVYNGSLKEEGRYTYAERDKAEEKLESLRAKATKKMYFLQPIKVPLGDAAAAGVVLDDEDAVPPPKKTRGEEEE